MTTKTFSIINNSSKTLFGFSPENPGSFLSITNTDNRVLFANVCLKSYEINLSCNLIAETTYVTGNMLFEKNLIINGSLNKLEISGKINTGTSTNRIDLNTVTTVFSNSYSGTIFFSNLNLEQNVSSNLIIKNSYMTSDSYIMINIDNFGKQDIESPPVIYATKLTDNTGFRLYFNKTGSNIHNSNIDIKYLLY